MAARVYLKISHARTENAAVKMINAKKEKLALRKSVNAKKVKKKEKKENHE